MAVALEPPLTRGTPQRRSDCPPDEPVATAPRFMRSGYQRLGNLGRWHRPRSGAVLGLTGKTVYRMWCGQGLFADRMLSAEELGDGDTVCGTCTGRAIGAGQDKWPVPGGPALLFEPRRLTPPRWCPGGRDARLSQVAGRKVFLCLACGELVPARSYRCSYAPAKHEPGPALVEGCPFHAWDHLIIHDGVTVCSCRVPKPEGSW